MSKTRNLILFVLFIFCSLISNGQNETNSPQFYFGGFNMNNGYVWPHSPRISYIKADAEEFQLKIYQNIRNIPDWINPYKATKFGYSLTYININNPHLGDVTGLSMFIEPMLYSYKKIHLYTHLSAGFSYSSTYYNRFTNDYNLLVSTPVSFFFTGKLNLDFDLTDKLSLGLNFGMSHCSNAALMLPNLGMNVVNYGVNLGYRVFTKNTPLVNIPKIQPFWEKNISIGYATRNCNEKDDKYYHVFTADLELSRHLNTKNALNISLNYLLRQGEINDNYFKPAYNSYYGIAVGHELFIKRLSLISQLGMYMYDTNGDKHFWYARLGVRYYIMHNFYTSILLTNRKQSADILQLSFGYSIK